jgi:tetratricopeptide (TPR) repeat protein
VKIRVLVWFPVAATLLLSWTVPAAHALPNEILMAQVSAQDYLEQGNARYKSKDYQGAIEDYTKAISLKPDYAEAYRNRGVARDGLKDYQGGIEDATKAADLFRKSGDTVNSRKAIDKQKRLDQTIPPQPSATPRKQLPSNSAIDDIQGVDLSPECSAQGSPPSFTYRLQRQKH